MILKPKNGAEIKNVCYFRIEPDFARATIKAYVFWENEDGEMTSVEIPKEELPGISIKENGETRFDVFE